MFPGLFAPVWEASLPLSFSVTLFCVLWTVPHDLRCLEHVVPAGGAVGGSLGICSLAGGGMSPRAGSKSEELYLPPVLSPLCFMIVSIQLPAPAAIPAGYHFPPSGRAPRPSATMN